MRLIAAFRPFFKNHISSAMLTFDRGHIISRLQLTATVHADSHSTARCKFFAVLTVAIGTVHRTLFRGINCVCTAISTFINHTLLLLHYLFIYMTICLSFTRPAVISTYCIYAAILCIRHILSLTAHGIQVLRLPCCLRSQVIPDGSLCP